MSEEQIELIIKFNGNEEEEIHDFNIHSYFKTNAHLSATNLNDDLWSMNRFLEKNYSEPHLDTPYSPPEFKA